jgi:hypothetical protein
MKKLIVTLMLVNSAAFGFTPGTSGFTDVSSANLEAEKASEIKDFWKKIFTTQSDRSLVQQGEQATEKLQIEERVMEAKASEQPSF